MLEWEAYHYFEPFGPPAEDDRWRLHYNLQWRAAFKNEPPEFLDRDPEETARHKAEAAAMTWEDKLFAFLEPRAVAVEPDIEPNA